MGLISAVSRTFRRISSFLWRSSSKSSFSLISESSHKMCSMGGICFWREGSRITLKESGIVSICSRFFFTSFNRSISHTRDSTEGRNSWRGGSSSLMVTGSPRIRPRIFLKSLFCIGSNLSIAFCLSCVVSARIISRTIGRRSAALNILSVRQRPIPSAPNFLAMAASLGVSALALTPRDRISSAHLRIVLRSGPNSGSTVGTSPW